jgi:tRNA (cmo5U34)-methyltransferase
MTQDNIFSYTTSRASDFEFNEEVVEVFNDMIGRSVPCYKEQQFMLREMAQQLYIPNTQVYDLGCSTATTLISMCESLDKSAKFVGYDNSKPMLDRSIIRIQEKGMGDRIELREGDFNGDLSKLPLENASLVTMCWTMQFVRPLQRERVVKWIYDGLVEGGALLLTEKVLSRNKSMNNFFIDLYYQFKQRNGYSETEILRKREALENVLVPYTLEENLELFLRNGFETCETFFQWYNFVGILCKKGGAKS